MKNTSTNKVQTRMLTAHFSLREMCASGTAIRLGIKNEPSEEVIHRLQQLCEHVLEPLRQRFGVIRITSGYRCDRLNRAVGGVKNSQHRLGEAADIHVSNIEVGRKMFRYIKENLDFDQLLFERIQENGACWLHVSFRAEPERIQVPSFKYKSGTGGRRLITMWCRQDWRSCSGSINVISTSCVSRFKFQVSRFMSCG